ncbi:MAG: outer membrane beta-barrel protein [Burkholderiaceae bacterium]
MKLAIATGTFGLVALATIAAPFAMADEPGWYIGGNVGQSRAKIDDQRIASDLLGGGLTATSISDRNHDTGYKLYGGYQFNPNFSMEGGYFDLGKFGFTANTSPAGTLVGNIKVRGLNLDLVGTLPITEKFSAFGRGGLIYSQSRDSFSGTGSVGVSNPNPSKSDTGYKFGLGLQYAFTKSLAMRTEVERYRINDAVGHKGDVDLVSVGLVYRFGQHGTPAVAQEAAPAPEPVREVVAPQAPAPVVVAQAPAPRFEKFTLSATELFAFGSDELRMPQPKLDEVVKVMRNDASIDHVVVSGNADRIGSNKDNQKLSELRAVAVRNYLISHGVEANRLTAEGNGESNPVVVCTDKNHAALVICLAPNRRVEVEHVTGERRVK